MGKADAVTKEYVSRSDIFADIFNQFLFWINSIRNFEM